MTYHRYTYAIGDVHGCFDELQQLLQQIEFSEKKDRLWFVGDLVNRGPKSLEMLRFIKSLPDALVVLGNHDLHLLAIANGHPSKGDTFQEILQAPDKEVLLNWLRMQPFMHYDATLGYVMAHAGIFPGWSLEEAKACAAEAEAAFRHDHYQKMLPHLYGNRPAEWSPMLAGWDRLRFIVNAFTRMRFCDPAGGLDLVLTGPPGSQPAGYLPWYAVPERKTKNMRIIFGHWAAHQGKTTEKNLYPLDTGCVWGGSLTALRLEDGQRFSVRSSMRKVIE